MKKTLRSLAWRVEANHEVGVGGEGEALDTGGRMAREGEWDPVKRLSAAHGADEFRDHFSAGAPIEVDG